MGEIRSPYFSIDQDYLRDNAEIRSPYFFSSGGDYHGDNAETHSLYSSVADYQLEDAEIPSETFFQQDNIVENPYNAEKFVEQDIVQNTYNTNKLIQQKNVEDVYGDIEAANVYSIEQEPYEWICIYRVPDLLRKSNEGIYTPQEVSIGPIHKKLKPMKTQKQLYLKAFCNRVGEKTKEQEMKFLDKLWSTIIEKAEIIHRCYEEDVHEVKGDEFVRMVLYDAVFILEYLLRNNDIEKYKDDTILSKIGSRGRIRRDLMLLENQLPFFILEELYNHLLADDEGTYPSFLDLAWSYFNRYNEIVYKPRDSTNILHFTDLIRSSLYVNKSDSRTEEPIGKFYRATQLQDAGINIKELQNECLLEIRFISTKKELRIPRLQINYNTELLFANLMALEHCHYQNDKYICHYFKLLDTLIGKPEDADLLIKKKIIESDREGAAVKSLIEKLATEAPEENSIYQNTYKQLDQYYKDSWEKNRSYFRDVYFGTLLKGTATVVAAIVLILTVVQTICSVVSLP